MFDHLNSTAVNNKQFVGSEWNALNRQFKVKLVDNFSYTDPVDGSVATNQVGLNNHHHNNNKYH